MRPRRLTWLCLASALVLSACGRNALPTAPMRANFTGHAAEAPTTAEQVLAVLKGEFPAASALIAQPLSYHSQAEIDGYLSSIAQGLPQTGYDREGFLDKLGIHNVHSPGKQDGPTFAAVQGLKGYRPGTLVDGQPIGSQVLAFEVAMAHPALFWALIRISNPSVEAPSREKGLWKEPFKSGLEPVPTGEVPQARYGQALAKLPRPVARFGLLFDDDVHAGIPTNLAIDNGSYGTYAIATASGFTPTQAWRIASFCDRIDYDTTPYGKTSFSPLGQMDRHFNLDRDGQDTRLVWAQRHLESARTLAATGAFDQAEIELGCGLHSLQDCFAHGQLTPSVHGIIGEFPDQVSYDPIAVLESREATVHYLQAYLEGMDQAHP